MSRKGIVALAAGLGLAAYLVAMASPQKAGDPIKVRSLPPGTTLTLQLGGFKTPTVTAPADDNGRTELPTGNIPPEGRIAEFWLCPDGRVIGVDPGSDFPCPGAMPLGSAPIVPGAEIFISTSGVVWTFTPAGTVASNANSVGVVGGASDTVIGVGPEYSIRPESGNQSYTIRYWDDRTGVTTQITGVVPADIGRPLQQLTQTYSGNIRYFTLDPMTGEERPAVPPTLVLDPPNTNAQDGGTGSAPSETPPAATPQNSQGWFDPGVWGPLGRPRYQTAALLMPFGASRAIFEFLLPQDTRKGQEHRISYAIVANGKSTGEAFTVLVNDPSGQTKAVPIPLGTALEPTGRRLAKPLPPESARGKQTLNSYCLQFHKEPPAPGMLYRIAGPQKQQADEPVRYVLGAINMLKVQGKLHPDIEMADYLDAIRQYALWVKLENWDQKQFTQNWIERTQKNALYFKVKWTKEMEKTLREAAPARWGDISQALDLASSTERAWKQALETIQSQKSRKP